MGHISNMGRNRHRMRDDCKIVIITTFFRTAHLKSAHHNATHLECWVSVRQVWLHALEHLSGCLGRLHENTHVVLDQTHEAHDLLGLWVHVSETTDADNEEELGLSIHEVVASSLGLAVHANTLGSDGAVLLDVLSGLVVSLGALDLPVLGEEYHKQFLK